ncbi:hypothetical protein BDQ17DRAFT_1327150 [Cyathus striatus]|nr:hypothetical protein BDQ17DRAFT_1327150 [Cyathus striatus]
MDMAASSSLPLIPELLRLICEEAASDKPTLAALARTCKAFEKPALDVLWFQLTDFYPLALCLPQMWRAEETRKVQDKDIRYVVHRGLPLVITPGINARFSRYSERVHRLNFDGLSHKMRVDISMLQALQIATYGANLLPNIQRLRWNCSEKDYIPFIPLFLGPCISVVSLTFTTGNIYQQMSLVPMLSNNFPSLKEITFVYPNVLNLPPQDLTNAVKLMSVSLYKLQRLELLTIPNVTYAAMRKFSLLPSLKRLDIRRWKPDSAVTNPQKGGFQALQYLKIGAYNASDSVLLLELMDSSPLIGVGIYFQGTGDSQSWKRVFTAISLHCRHDTVRDIHCVDGMAIRSQVGAVIPPGEMLDYGAIKPLTVFSNLESLHVEVVRGFYLSNPGATREMAESWTKIKTLLFTLQLRRRSQQASMIKLQDLLPFAQFCPDLKKLGIFIDVKNPPEIDDKWRPGNGVHQSSLTELYVLDSPARSPTQIAAFLSSCFPTLQKIFARNVEAQGDQVLNMEDSKEVWGQVQHLLSAFTAVRKQERSYSQ